MFPAKHPTSLLCMIRGYVPRFGQSRFGRGNTARHAFPFPCYFCLPSPPHCAKVIAGGRKERNMAVRDWLNFLEITRITVSIFPSNDRSRLPILAANRRGLAVL